MANPVLVQTLRAGRVESAHRGAFAVVDPAGRIVLAAGDVDRPIYPRSAVKALQAIPLVETGAADRFALTDAEIALACASHHGEEDQARTAATMLAKAGLDASALECGVHWPSSATASRALAAAGLSPTALHNNCSGKHAGFLCVACAESDATAGYVRPDHPAQRRVTRVLSEMTGVSIDEAAAGTDGCSIPTHPLPLAALARAFARFATGAGLDPTRAAAASRIRAAIAAAPGMLAGGRHADTLIARAFGLDALAKVGAEGVYCGALPGQGLGVAIKIDDGAMPAAAMVMAALIERFSGPLSAERADAIEAIARPVARNWNGVATGSSRMTLDGAD
jgi:L-asparaginase II